MDKKELSVRISMSIITILNAASSHLQHRSFGEKFQLQLVKVRCIDFISNKNLK